jgi:RNA polymerase sigma-70 factor (ECF subfamily)
MIDGELSSTIIKQIHLEIEKLPKRQREVIKMAYFQNISSKEIAEKLDITMATVRSMKRTGVDKLKETVLKNINDYR